MSLSRFENVKAAQRTNTTERVAAAKAILEYLNRSDNIVMVAIHDIEVADLLGHRYESHHFREIIHHQQMEV